MNISKANPDLFRTPQRKSTTQLVIEKIKNLIMTGELSPGQQIPNELELTLSFGASRGSVREALKILESFGIIEIKRGDGTYISTNPSKGSYDHLLFQLMMTKTDKDMILQLRKLFELGIVDILLEEKDNTFLPNLYALYAQMEHFANDLSKTPEQLADIDIQFHKALSHATGNPLIEKIYEFTLELFKPTILKTHLATEGRHGANALIRHKRIIEALEMHNKSAVHEAISESLSTWINLSLA